jgi:hypothetical protein
MTAFGVAVAVVTGVSAAAQPPSPDFLLAAFADNQQRFRSGVMRAVGTVSSKSSEFGPVNGPVTIFCAFNVDAELFRFDRTEPRPKSLWRPASTGPNNAGPTTVGGKYAETPKRFVAWNAERPKHVRLLPIHLPKQSVGSVVSPFDPRILGLANWITVRHRYDASAMIPDLSKRLAGRPVAVTEPRPGLYRVRWAEPHGGLEIDFDRDVGHMPVRHVDLAVPAAGRPPVPFGSAVTTWQAQSGVYVPVTASFQDGPDDWPQLSRYDLRLTWEVVNGRVDEALTTARGMDLPPDTLITDNTQGDRGVPLGSVGDLTPDPRLAAAENNDLSAPTRSGGGWNWTAVALTVGAVALVAAIILAARRSRD